MPTVSEPPPISEPCCCPSRCGSRGRRDASPQADPLVPPLAQDPTRTHDGKRRPTAIVSELPRGRLTRPRGSGGDADAEEARVSMTDIAYPPSRGHQFSERVQLAGVPAEVPGCAEEAVRARPLRSWTRAGRERARRMAHIAQMRAIARAPVTSDRDWDRYAACEAKIARDSRAKEIGTAKRALILAATRRGRPRSARRTRRTAGRPRTPGGDDSSDPPPRRSPGARGRS